MNVMNRKAKINKVSQIARPIFDNRKGKIVYRVDSLTDDRPLQVSTEVYRNGVLQARVSHYDFDHKQQKNEKGNTPSDFGKGIDYKALGALKRRARDAGKALSLCLGKDGYGKALRLLNLGGELIKISNLGNGVVWGVLR